ncbi:MAG: hypothetical protein FWJ74_08270 [Gemmatimonadota bacterium]
MLLSLALATLLQLPTPDSVYATPALRALVARAAENNRRVPAELRGYRALTESEAALIVHTAEGEELSGQIEQIATRLQWRRDGSLEMRVVGHRIQTAGFSISVLSYLPGALVAPILYGESLQLFATDTTWQADSPEAAKAAGEAPPRDATPGDEKRGRKRRPVYESIHPFSEARETYYRFEGGDTVAVLHLPDRTVRVVRLRVTPRRWPTGPALLFSGDIDLDAERFHIVRMRGELATVNSEAGRALRLLGRLARGVAYIELENAEFEGRYWLPYRQRVEFQATSPLTDARAVVRIVTRLRDHGLDLRAPEAGATAAVPGVAADTTAAPGVAADTTAAAIGAAPAGAANVAGADAPPDSAAARLAPGAAPPDSAAAPPDSAGPLRFRLTFAPGDTISRFDGWSWDLGEATSPLSARDFDDVAPPALRPDGPPALHFGVRRLSDALRFNRVEGLFTGVGATLAFRDAAPGLALHANAGWAWAAETPRGALELSIRRGAWEATARAARELAHTNDFASPWERGGSVFTLLGADDAFDYVDRRDVALALARTLGGGDSRLRIEAGWAEDRAEQRRVLRRPFGGDTLRPNRPVEPGRYFLTRLTLEHGRSVQIGSLRPGLGAGLTLEQATGELDWRRVEGRIHLRTMRGPWTLAARLDAGIVTGDAPPPQTLYEIGTWSTLPGYHYKEFAGDRAAVFRGMIRFDPGILDTPIRFGEMVFPAISPAPAVQWHAGWTDAPGDAAAAAVQTLGSRPTGGVRSAVDLELTFFGGVIGVGIARALDRHEDWGFVFSVGGVH